MNCPPEVMQAKIALRNTGWTWNRKLRCWEITVDSVSYAVPQTLDALRVQREFEARGVAPVCGEDD
jgi:hypothetical protein